MSNPHTAEFPLVAELHPAPDAADVFRRLSTLPGCVFLDSSLRHPQLGRYSYVASDPFQLMVVPVTKRAAGENSFVRLKQKLRSLATPARPGLPPFQGGAAGVFGYELGRELERLPSIDVDEFQIPAVAVGLYDVVVTFDHQQRRAWIVSQGFPETELAARRQRAAARLDQVQRWLDQPAESVDFAAEAPRDLVGPVVQVSHNGALLSNFSAETYRAAVARVIEFIRAGDIFQANLSQRLLHPIELDSVSLYLRLRSQTPATFAGYFAAGDFQVISASPERFLRVQGRQVESRPIKGTRPQLAGPLADMYSGQELLGSEKDRAENVMIVDLLRNDISRSCEPHSVTVPVLCGLESYGYVQHLVSVVCGQLRPECHPLDLLAAAFPGGSITGAPKIRAMEIITELEHVPRGAYCGCLGYVSAAGEMDLNILIRTITAARGWWQMPVGGGIVADSDPQREYDETWHKAAGVLPAMMGERGASVR